MYEYYSFVSSARLFLKPPFWYDTPYRQATYIKVIVVVLMCYFSINYMLVDPCTAGQVCYIAVTFTNPHGEPMVDLSADNMVSIHNADELTDLQLKHHRVIKKLFSEHGITAPVTKNLCDILRCKLWRMGKKLNKAGAKRSKILEGWKEGDDSVWELSTDCVTLNKELGTQILSNEKEINKLKQENSSLQAELNGTHQKLKEIQNIQTNLIKTNKRMSSALVAGPNPKRKKKDLSILSCQQQWNRKKQLHGDITHALSFLDPAFVSYFIYRFII